MFSVPVYCYALQLLSKKGKCLLPLHYFFSLKCLQSLESFLKSSVSTFIQEHDNFMFSYTGETQDLYGVGLFLFIITNYLIRSIVSFNWISERFFLLKLNINLYLSDILQVYAPAEELQRKMSWMESLEEAFTLT